MHSNFVKEENFRNFEMGERRSGTVIFFIHFAEQNFDTFQPQLFDKKYRIISNKKFLQTPKQGHAYMSCTTVFLAFILIRSHIVWEKPLYFGKS